MEPRDDAVERVRQAWRTTGAASLVVGFAVAVASVLSIAQEGDRAFAQDCVSLAVGIVFMLVGAWLVIVRARRKVMPTYRSGVSVLLLCSAVIAGGIVLIWDIASHAP